MQNVVKIFCCNTFFVTAGFDLDHCDVGSKYTVVSQVVKSANNFSEDAIGSQQ